MSELAANLDDAAAAVPLSMSEALGIWFRHLASLVIPSITLVFVWTGPHPWYVAPVFMLPLGIVLFVDLQNKAELRQPTKAIAAWPFDGLVYVLAALQLAIVAGTVLLFTRQTIFSVDMVMVLVLIGGSSGFSIITAHELIHRRSKLEQALGRLLLCSVLYEHFYTEHVRGHHVRVGTPEDPATARFGERFWTFYRRTVPGQFRSAWRLETERLGDVEMRPWNPRILSSRVVHGLIAGWTLAFTILATFGTAAFVMFLAQAWRASMLLEYVNYFEHWGLMRTGRRIRTVDSWDTDSAFTLYALVGLSRHADHHAFAVRPFQALRHWEESPKLSRGYIALLPLVLFRNQRFMTLMTEELQRRKLGPFASPEAEPARAELVGAAEP